MDKQQITLLKDLRSLLNYHVHLGLEDYPVASGVADFVEKIKIFSNIQPVESSNEKNEAVSLDEQAPVQSKGNGGTIQEIAEEVRICTSCNLHEKRIAPVPGSGGKKIKIFIVGGWLASEEGRHIPEGTVFGVEEDAMVSRMLSAIGLSREDAFITNAIKCGVPTTIQPVADNIHACASYLHRQITVLAPDIICAMGMIASRILLDIPRPLSQLRGRFYTITTSDKKNVPLLPTYHPTFLLQNPEMKKATWVDLQLIQKELKKPTGSC